MKILHVCSNYFPAHGGPQYTMKNLSEKLVQYYDDEVEVVTTNSYFGPEMPIFKKISPGVEILNGVAIKRMPFRRWHYPVIKFSGKVYGKLFNRGLPYPILKLRWGLDSPGIIKHMNDSTADVIMATTANYNFNDYPLWRFKTKKPKPFVLYGAIHLHRDLPAENEGIKRAKICDCYISNTWFETEKLIEYGVPAEKIETIGTGIALEDFDCTEDSIRSFKKQYGIEESDIVIGYVGRLSKGKGAGLLLDAFRQLYRKNKKLKLLLAGTTTDYVPEIRKVILGEQLPVILIENFDNEKKPLIFHALDIFVLPSQSESFGVVFLEAWASGKPVVATDMGATASLLRNNKDSMLIEPGNVDDLVEKLERLIADKGLRDLLALNGYKKLIEHYTWEKIVAAYRRAYIKGIENFTYQYPKLRRPVAPIQKNITVL